MLATLTHDQCGCGSTEAASGGCGVCWAALPALAVVLQAKWAEATCTAFRRYQQDSITRFSWEREENRQTASSISPTFEFSSLVCLSSSHCHENCMKVGCTPYMCKPWGCLPPTKYKWCGQNGYEWWCSTKANQRRRGAQRVASWARSIA
jgi:hypothetical protein